MFITNINYGSTAVYWASYIRDIFMQYVYDEVISARMILSGVVEVDESTEATQRQVSKSGS